MTVFSGVFQKYHSVDRPQENVGFLLIPHVLIRTLIFLLGIFFVNLFLALMQSVYSTSNTSSVHQQDTNIPEFSRE